MKMFLVKRKILTAAVCLLLAAGMFYVVNHPAIVGAAAAARQLPIYCVQRDQKVLSISFDAAWGNEDTQMLIDILGKYKIKATFFVVGEWVDKYPESVKALHDAGHEVMNHSNTHAHMSQLSKDEIIADVEACNDKIEAVTGVRPTLIRPPYGEYNDNLVLTAKDCGYFPVEWSVDSLDWKDYGVNSILDMVLKNKELRNGAIILCHNGAKYTSDALEQLIIGLEDKGYQIVPVSQLIYKDNYHMDVTGRQIKD